MKLAVFSAKSYDKLFLDSALEKDYASFCEIVYHSFALSSETVSLAKNSDAVCAFVNDTLDGTVLKSLHAYGIRAILLRCAGFNNVDLQANVPLLLPRSGGRIRRGADPDAEPQDPPCV